MTSPWRTSPRTPPTTPQATCAWDTDDEQSGANPLAMGTPFEGYLCPLADQDWYRIDVPSPLLTIELSIDAPVTPINPTYTLWDATGSEVVAGPAVDESAAPTLPLSIVHGVTPGPYLLVVRDGGNDGEDLRHSYMLNVTSSADPDPLEPNDDDATATPLSGSTQGLIAYRGDRDVYAIDAPVNALLRVRLEMLAGGIEPAFQILDPAGEVLISQSNDAGSREPTALEYIQPAVEAGIYHVIVHDDDDLDWDDTNRYTLTVEVLSDPDVNEPNDEALEATVLPSLTCGADFSADAIETGYIASTGDADWYQLDLTGCDQGILEVDVDFDSNALPEGLEAEVRLVREVPGEACELDQDCQQLSAQCGANMDCPYVGNTCLNSGYCAGAGACLPSGNCGAHLLIETSREESPEMVRLGAPLTGFGTVWIVVSDHLSDTLSIDRSYTVRARVRTDPDLSEPNDHYTGGPPTGNDHGYHAPNARQIPIYDCAAVYPDPVECCATSPWIEGTLGYTYDQDWFWYEHPCPGEDCMVKVHYELDGGTIDHYIRIFASSSLWHDGVTLLEEEPSQPAIDDAYGGLLPTDECFYAFQGHSGDPFPYYIALRDTVLIPGNPTGGTWDFDSDQKYRLCVEKIENQCVDPCYDWPKSGCGPAQ